MRTPAIAVFDIGKTNKKFFLLDPELNELHHEYQRIEETEDDDGFPGEDLSALSAWMKEVMAKAMQNDQYRVHTLNFSGYGASLVHLDERGELATPFYNYLKPFPEDLQQQFYDQYGPPEQHDLETASPTLGMLNSGLQLYWLKQVKPQRFGSVRHTLHLPQYLSYLFTGELVSEPTSVGCHTKLWDFRHGAYHAWVRQEGLERLLPTIVPTDHHFDVKWRGQSLKVGVGIHDSSAALVPYQHRRQDPFMLLSTGTWNISLNSFTKEVLSRHELQRDCLTFLDPQGKPVKAARLFLGNELEHQLKKLNEIFSKNTDDYQAITLDERLLDDLASGTTESLFYPETIDNPLPSEVLPQADQWHPEALATYEEAYHHLLWGLAVLQRASLRLAQGASPVRQVFVDGGFANNPLFIDMLRQLMPDHTFHPSPLPMGSAYGAAMVMG